MGCCQSKEDTVTDPNQSSGSSSGAKNSASPTPPATGAATPTPTNAVNVEMVSPTSSRGSHGHGKGNGMVIISSDEAPEHTAPPSSLPAPSSGALIAGSSTGLRPKSYSAATDSSVASSRARRSSFVIETDKASIDYDEDGNKRINQYIVKGRLGVGSYGKVKLCIDDKGNKFAMKIMNKSLLKRRRIGGMNTALNDVLREIAILKKLDHPNICLLSEVIDDPSEDKLFMIMEYCDGGSVGGAELQSDPIPVDLTWRYLRDIISGLEYLHHQKVIHRDIKPENILIHQGVLKLSDFGVSDIYEGEDDQMKRAAGSPAFLAPEACAAKGAFAGRSIDVWAVGVTLYIFIFGKVPFVADTVVGLYEVVMNDDPDFSHDPPLDPLLLDLFHQLFEKDPDKRITVQGLRDHPWVTKNGSAPMPELVVLDLPEPTAEEVNSAIHVTERFALMVKIKWIMAKRKREAQERLRRRKLAKGDGGEATNPLLHQDSFGSEISQGHSFQDWNDKAGRKAEREDARARGLSNSTSGPRLERHNTEPLPIRTNMRVGAPAAARGSKGSKLNPSSAAGASGDIDTGVESGGVDAGSPGAARPGAVNRSGAGEDLGASGHPSHRSMHSDPTGGESARSLHSVSTVDIKDIDREDDGLDDIMHVDAVRVVPSAPEIATIPPNSAREVEQVVEMMRKNESSMFGIDKLQDISRDTEEEIVSQSLSHRSHLAD